MLAGAIEIQMLADLARLRDDVDRGVAIVERGAKEIQNVASLAGKALGLFGVALSAGAFANWIKGAIDSADALDEMSSRIGIGAGELSRLQLAYKMAGLGQDAMQSSLSKLSKEIASGNSAFDTLGVKTRNADGTLRSATEVMADVADGFAGIEDGSAKTALAMDIFGKSGADMVGLLNGGSEEMDRMAQMAVDLGIALDDETAAGAAKFNDTLDLMGQSLQGMATRTMAQLLPTLNRLAGVFFENVASSGALGKAADALAASLKLLFSSGLVIVEIFSTIGKTIGAAGAQIVAVMQGDFKGAARIGQEYASDVKAGWSNTATALSKVWSESGDKTVESLAGIAKEQRKLSVQSTEEAAASKKLAEQKAAAARKEEEDYSKLIAKIRERSKALADETALGRAQTEAEKLAAEVTAKYTGTKRDQALAEIAAMKAAEDHKAAQEALKKASAEAAAARAKETEAVVTATAKLQEDIEAQRLANETLATGVDRSAELTIAKLRDAAASADRKAMVALERAEDVTLYEQLKAQADKLRELADLKEQGIHVKAAKDANEEWKKTTESIGQGLTDSLFRAFEAGRGSWTTLWDGIKNTLKTTVLQVAINAVMNPINSLVGSAMSGIGGSLFSGAAGAATGGAGGLGGTLAGIGSLFGAGGMGGALTAGAGWLTGATSLSGALGAAGSLIGTGSAGGIMSGLAMGAGALGPIALGVALLHKLGKGDSGTQHQGSTAYASATGSGTTLGRELNFLVESIDRNKAQDDPVLRAAQSVSGILNAFGGITGSQFRVDTGFADDSSKDGAFGAMRVSRDGQSILDWESGRTSKWAPKTFADGEEGFKQYLAALASSTKQALGSIGLPEWAQDTLAALGGAPTLEQLAKAADQIAQTQALLTAVGEQFAPLGGVFSRVAMLSDEATLELARFAGGLDQLVAKTQAYVEAYYSEAEKAGMQAAAIKKVLDEAGLSASLSSKEDLRALVDSRDVSTEQGRRELAALLDVAGGFASVAEYLQANGGTLDSLAATAPQVELLQTQLDQQSQQIDAAQQTVNAINTVNSTMESVHQAVQDGLQRVAEKLDQVAAGSASSSRWLADSMVQALSRRPETL